MGSPAEDATAIVKALAAAEESYYVEFNSAYTYGPDGRAPRDAREIATDIGQTIVAFANSDGGDLLVGVEDDGSITGIPHRDDRVGYLRAWQQQLLDAGEGVSVRVFDVEIDGLRVLLFRTEASSGVVAAISDGRCLIRKKAASVPTSAQKIEQRRAHVLGDRDYEALPVPEATLEDLDWDLIRGRNHRQSSGSRSFDEFDDVALLRYWNLIEQRNGNVVLRRAALLLFAKDALRWHPNNRVRIRRVLGNEVGYGRHLRSQEKELLGPIAKLLIETSVVLRMTLKRESRQDQLFSTSTLLPGEAVAECIVNAVIHRNYAIEGQAVEILLFPDRVEFKSPGRLLDPITVEDLKAQKGVHVSRNPVMMRVLRDWGCRCDQGEGMARIFGSMRQVELHEPELEEVADTFVVRLSTRSVYDASTQAWIASYGPFGLQPEERRYLVVLRQAGGQLSIDRLARQLGESFDQVKAALASLEKRSLVWHPRRSRSYHLVEPLNVPHERVYRLLEKAGIPTDRSAILEREHIAQLAKTDDQRSTSALIDQWKQAGILTPAGSKRWKLGASFLAYVDQRSAVGSSRSEPE
jgi:ATP-dependent DNA helicase RecG